MKLTVLMMLVCGMVGSLFGQAPGVPIFDQSRKGLQAERDRIGQRAEEFLEAGGVVSYEGIKEKMKNPDSAQITLSSPAEEALTNSQVMDKALKGSFRLGWSYLCMKCDTWHARMGGGYAISEDGYIATCAHIVDPGDLEMREGALIAVDHEGNVFPVTKVVRYHDKMDAAVVKIEKETIALAFNDNVRPGDAAFCFSRPLNQGKYFSTGIINRFFWEVGPKKAEDQSVATLAYLRVNVSSRWAPGSSGSPVLDQNGNVIGHVSKISSRASKKGGLTVITLHSAIPARSVQALCEEESSL